jgi:hypothetical protein
MNFGKSGYVNNMESIKEKKKKKRQDLGLRQEICKIEN